MTRESASDMLEFTEAQGTFAQRTTDKSMVLPITILLGKEGRNALVSAVCDTPLYRLLLQGRHHGNILGSTMILSGLSPRASKTDVLHNHQE